MISLVCYASDNMTISQEHLVVSSLKNGVDRVFSYNKQDIDPLFYAMNQEALDAERGAGYWLWKPYVINKAIHQLTEDDILIYADSGIKIIENVQAIITRMMEDIFFFSNGWPYFDWCKKKVMDAIYPEWAKDWEVRNERPQVQASVIFFKVTDMVKVFLREWLSWCQMPGFIDDSNYDTHKGFQEHRHDQSILSLLQMKYGFSLHWWPTWYAEHLERKNDTYPPLFDHHRKRNNEW